MRLVAHRQTLEGCPPEIARVAGFSQSVTNITKGNQYEAFAVSIYKGIPYVQIINDKGFIAWLPQWLFSLVNNDVPTDWIINFFEGDVSVVLGPVFVAESVEAYEAMVSEEVSATTQFWNRVKERET